ncbi:MAG: DUF2306 domain-containing protein [Burkholderiales bacterium]|nr:DUF2306 domain-containing protein [Burkholderiales bacterium]
MRRTFRIGIWIALAALLALGVGSAVQRGIAVGSADPGAFDREQLEVIASISGLEGPSPERERLAAEIAASAANLNGHPRATYAHLVPGALLFLLAPLQFSRRLRARHPAVHRWNGRFLLAMIVAGGVAGMYLGAAKPYGGALETLATTVFGGFFLFAAARGYAAIRARRIALHREWMIRMFAIAVGISVIRVVGMAGVVVFGSQHLSADSFALSLWIGWLLTMAVAELYILGTRARRTTESAHGLQPL